MNPDTRDYQRDLKTVALATIDTWADRKAPPSRDKTELVAWVERALHIRSAGSERSDEWKAYCLDLFEDVPEFVRDAVALFDFDSDEEDEDSDEEDADDSEEEDEEDDTQ